MCSALSVEKKVSVTLSTTLPVCPALSIVIEPVTPKEPVICAEPLNGNPTPLPPPPPTNTIDAVEFNIVISSLHH